MAHSAGFMTSTAIIKEPPPAARERIPERPPLIPRPLLLRFVSIAGAASSFYLPLSVVPLYTRSAGSAAGAGYGTGALLLATVAVELFTPRLVARTGYQLALSVGLLFLACPRWRCSHRRISR
jgi:hypothetical protein